MRKILHPTLITLFGFFGSLLLVSPGYSASNESPAYQKDKIYKLTILHTNDHHGRFWKNGRGEYGLSARKTLIDRIRGDVEAKGGHVLLLSGGDINTGVPESDTQFAEPDFKAMNKLGYDAMAVGNHEFDNPLYLIRRQEGWAGFPFLSANIFRKDTRDHLFQPYKTFSFDDLKVTVIGFTTQDTKIIGNPEYTQDIDFGDPISTAQYLLPQIEKKTDIMIGLTHMGHYADGNYGGNAPGDVSLARSTRGLDVIVGGHSQNPLFEPDFQYGTMIVQAHEWGKYVGRIDLEFLNGKVTLKSYKLVPVNLKKKVKIDGKSVRIYQESQIREDPEMMKFLKPYQERGQKKLNVVVGRTNGVFVGERNIVRNQETNLGNLIGMSVKTKTNADVAIMNSGGIRADLPKGKVTYKDILTVQPFSNTVTTVKMTGKELHDYLQVVVNKKKGSGAFPQFVGVELEVQGEELKKVKVGGKVLEQDQQYKLAILSFTAAGGDGYPKLSEHKNYVNTGYVDADVLREYIRNNSPLKVKKYAPTNDVMRK